MTGTEDAGKALGGFVEAMKSQPLSLALVVMNIALLYILLSVYGNSNQNSKEQMQLIFAAQEKMQVLLSRCVVPDR